MSKGSPGTWGRLVRRLGIGPGSVIRRLGRIEHKLERLEAFSHGARATYVGNNRVLMKALVADRTIAFLLEANDRLLSPWFIVAGQYEKPLTDYFVRELKPDSHCLDLGSNFGYFTCLMSRFCPDGRVIGVEADRAVRDLAWDNLAINGFTGFADVIHAAASDSDAPMTLYRRHSRSANTSMTAMSKDATDLLGEKGVTAFEARGVRVDDVVAERLGGRVDFIKIDIEGAEPLAFRGAERTIADNPQLRIVMEWSPGQIQGAGFDVAEFLSHLDAQGLRPFDLDEGGVKPISYATLRDLPYRAGIVLQR